MSLRLHRRSVYPNLVPRKVQVIAGQASAAAVTATYAAVPRAGNLLIAAVRSNGGSADQATHAMPAGWAKAAGANRAIGSAATSVWWKIAGASEPAGVTASDAVGTTTMDLALLEYTNGDPAPVDATATFDGGAATVTTLTVGPSPATTAPSEIVVAVIGANGSTGTWGNTWTNGFVQTITTTRLGVAVQIVTATGTFTTNETWTTIRLVTGIFCSFKSLVA